MQSDLCFTIEDALREATRTLGGSKALGHRLRPELDPDAAGRWWLDCLNHERAQKPSLDQVLCVMRWARAESCHAVMDFIARDCGYTEPEPVTPEDEAAELQRQFVHSVSQLQQLAARIERNKAAPRPRRQS